MGTKENGDDDWAVFGGIASLEAGVLYIDRGENKPRFEIREEWLVPAWLPTGPPIVYPRVFVLVLIFGSAFFWLTQLFVSQSEFVYTL